MNSLARSLRLLLFVALIFLCNGCSTLQTKSSHPSHVGQPYSGVKKAAKSFEDGPPSKHVNHDPSGPIGVGAFFIPVQECVSGAFFYLYTTIDLVCSLAGDTLTLPVDLMYLNDFEINQAVSTQDIQMLLQQYQMHKISEPPLIGAIMAGDHQKIATLLQTEPACVNDTGPLGFSPLFYATAIGDQPGIDLLVDAGAGLTPAYAGVVIAYVSDETTLLYLMDQMDVDLSSVAPDGPFHGSNLLTAALRNGHRKLALKVFDDGGSDLNHRDSDGMTSLLWAIRAADLDLAVQLFEHGATLQDTDRLMEAALEQEDRRFFDLLLDEGASLPVNALLLAVENDDVTLMQRLIEMGADLNARDYAGNCALHLAASANKPALIQRLVDAGLSINSRNERGATPLWTAVHGHNPEAVQLLLQLGADPKIPMKSASRGDIRPMKEALRPLFSAYQSPENSERRRKIIQMLIPKAATYDDLTYAVRIGDRAAVTSLIDSGIDPNAGVAIYYAEDDGVLDLLVGHGGDANDRKRFSACVERWRTQFANTYYSGTPEENCEYHCQQRTEGFCP